MKKFFFGSSGDGKKPSSEVRRYFVFLIINTILFSGVYFYLNRIGFWPVFWIWAVLLGVLALGFVIYNRGFSRAGVTADMLPADWTEEKKQAFLEERDERMAKSRWLLVLIVPLLASFLLDFLYIGIEDLLVACVTDDFPFLLF